MIPGTTAEPHGFWTDTVRYVLLVLPVLVYFISLPDLPFYLPGPLPCAWYFFAGGRFVLRYHVCWIVNIVNNFVDPHRLFYI